MNIGTFTFKILEIKQANLISVTFLDPRTNRESIPIDIALWGEAKQKLSQIENQEYILARGFLSQRNIFQKEGSMKVHMHALTLDFL